jgi:aminopeptidase N
LRGFSAPVILDHDISNEQRAFLLAHDSDPFNRWEAASVLARTTLMDMATTDAAPDSAWLDGILAVLRDETLDPAYRALMLAIPGQSELAAALHEADKTPDPDAIWAAREALKQAMAEHAQDLTPRLAAQNQIDGAYAPDAGQSGKRALAGAALAMISRLDGGAAAAAQYGRADNMTLQLSALACLLSAGKGLEELAAFRAQWQGDRLVMDKWFGLQVIQAEPARAVEVARSLTRDAAFNWKNPNRFRAVFGALAGNHAGFHNKDGSGYKLLADWLIRLDAVNPQTTARMCSAFQTWRRYDKSRQALLSDQLSRIADTPGLSRDTSEMISRIRGI